MGGGDLVEREVALLELLVQVARIVEEVQDFVVALPVFEDHGDLDAVHDLRQHEIDLGDDHGSDGHVHVQPPAQDMTRLHVLLGLAGSTHHLVRSEPERARLCLHLVSVICSKARKSASDGTYTFGDDWGDYLLAHSSGWRFCLPLDVDRIHRAKGDGSTRWSWGGSVAGSITGFSRGVASKCMTSRTMLSLKSLPGCRAGGQVRVARSLAADVVGAGVGARGATISRLVGWRLIAEAPDRGQSR